MEPLSEKEFYSTYTDIFYKTSNSEFGKYKTQIPFGKSFGKNSTFTTVIRFAHISVWGEGAFQRKDSKIFIFGDSSKLLGVHNTTILSLLRTPYTLTPPLHPYTPNTHTQYPHYIPIYPNPPNPSTSTKRGCTGTTA